MIQHVKHQGETLAIILPANYSEPGIHFFTPDSFSQQLGFMKHPAGHCIEPHRHKTVKREVKRTQEVLVIRKGRLRVDFYDKDDNRVESRELGAGDVILLASGGHGFEVLEPLEMIEIKQGPFVGTDDKVRFCAS